MRRIQSNISTNEEKSAKRITNIIQDLNLDLNMLGFYVATTMPYLHFNRFLEVAESAEHEYKMRTDINYQREFHKLGL